MDIDTTNQRLQASNILDKVYAITVIMEGQMSSTEMQAAVGNNYGQLLITFKNILKVIKS